MSVNIETTRTKERLLISVPTDNISEEEIEELISYLKTDFLIRKSEMSESQAEEISESIKSGWWNENGLRIKRMIGEND